MRARNTGEEGMAVVVLAALARDEDTGPSSRLGQLVWEMPRCQLLEGQLQCRMLAEECEVHRPRYRLLGGTCGSGRGAGCWRGICDACR